MALQFGRIRLLWLFAILTFFTFSAPENANASGVCGYANGNSYSSAPQSVGSLCATGTASSVTGNGPWNWTCSDGASVANCSSGLCGVTFEWREGTFGACDCATSLQSRGVWCYRNGVMTDPDQSGCYSNAGPKPPWQQSCTPSGCVVPVAGACNNATVNGCSSGSAIEISSDASNDYWKCSGSGGGANSGQCQKAKASSCNPSSIFAWVSGVFPSERTTFFENRIGDNGNSNITNLFANTIPAGNYENAFGSETQPGPFYVAGEHTLDGIVIGAGTRIRIYSAANFGGSVVFDKTGPYVLANCSDEGGMYNFTGRHCNDLMTADWSSQGGVFAQFPTSTRHIQPGPIWTMHGWSGSGLGSPNAGDTGVDGASIQVTCDNGTLPTLAPVNGTCGWANGSSYNSANLVNRAGLCSSGFAPGVTGSPASWSWTCVGYGPGHTDQSCSATRGTTECLNRASPKWVRGGPYSIMGNRGMTQPNPAYNASLLGQNCSGVGSYVTERIGRSGSFPEDVDSNGMECRCN